MLIDHGLFLSHMEEHFKAPALKYMKFNLKTWSVKDENIKAA